MVSQTDYEFMQYSVKRKQYFTLQLECDYPKLRVQTKSTSNYEYDITVATKQKKTTITRKDIFSNFKEFIQLIESIGYIEQEKQMTIFDY